MVAYKAWASAAIPHIKKETPLHIAGPETTDQEFHDAILKVYKFTGDWKGIPELLYNQLEPQLGLDREKKIAIANRVKEITGSADKRLCRAFAVKLYFDTLPNEAA